MGDMKGLGTEGAPPFEAMLGATGVRVEDVFENLGEGLVLASFAGDLVHWNRAALDMHGMTSVEEVRRPLADFVATYEFLTLTGEAVPFRDWPMSRLMRGEAVTDLELRVRRLDMPWDRIMSYGGSVIRSNLGAPVMAVLHIRDVTGKKLADLDRERDLRRQTLLHRWSARLIEGHVTSADVGALLTDLDQMLGFDVSLYYLPDPRTGVMQLAASRGISQALQPRVAEMPIDLGNIIGKVLGVRALSRDPLVTPEGRVLGVMFLGSTTRECTEDQALIATLCHTLVGARERELALASLHANEQSLRDAVENMAMAQRAAHIGSWEVALDESGRPTDPTFWSDETFRICGYSPGEVTPTIRLIRDMTHPDDLPNIGKATTPESPEVIQDVRIVRADGSIRYVHMRSRSFSNPETGRPARRIGTIQDVTERELVQAELRKLHEELERRVEERTAELRAANGELAGFAYAVSHDLRAPLRAIVGFSHALIEDLGPDLSADAKGSLAHIISGGNRMSELIDGILKLTRLSRSPMELGTVDLTALANDIVESLEPDAAINILVDHSLYVTADLAMMRVVMQNLIENAVKYCGKNANAQIRITRLVRDGRSFVVVKDNGAGFAMEHAAQLFQPFSRLHRQDEFPGIGIGLATVHRILRRHMGETLAEGAVGMGATIGFWIPERGGARS